jgi:uncharacterized protein HemX
MSDTAQRVVQVEATEPVEYVQLAASKTVWKLVAALSSLIFLGFGTWMGFMQSELRETQRAQRISEQVREQTRAESAERIGRLEEKVGSVERGIGRVETNLERALDKLDRLIGPK